MIDWLSGWFGSDLFSYSYIEREIQWFGGREDEGSLVVIFQEPAAVRIYQTSTLTATAQLRVIPCPPVLIVKHPCRARNSYLTVSVPCEISVFLVTV